MRGGKRSGRRLNLRKLLIVSAIVYVAVLFLRQQFSLYDQKRQIESLQEQIAAEQETQAQLRRDIAFSQTEEYMETAARDKLGWIRKDEILFIND